MKITVLEYEEDPNQGSSSSSAPIREQPVIEYTLEVVSRTSNNDSNKNSINDGTPVSSYTNIVSQHKLRRDAYGEMVRSPLKVLRKLFLPLGYPHSVSETYLPYQLYDGLQGLCSYWRGVVSAKAVFEAAGVGNSEATALSAALSWALRDGTGMIGGLAYSYTASSYFDSHAKEFRLLLADVINDIALTLDMVAPYFGRDGSVWILGLSTIGKTICGITAGATKGHITQHFAANGGNVADLTAKESTQETLVSLLGMMGGVWVAKVLDRYGQSDPFFWTWLLFGILTVIHVWANYKAVSLLKLATLNPERTRVLFRESIDVMARRAQQDLHSVRKDDDGDVARKTNGTSTATTTTTTPPELMECLSKIPPPELVEESLFSSVWNLFFCKICVSSSPDWNNLQACSLYRYPCTNDEKNDFDLPYVIGYDAKAVVYVWLKIGATVEDELQAYLHALLLQKLFSSGVRVTENTNEYSNSSLLQGTREEVVRLFGSIGDNDTTPSVETLMERIDRLGWDLSGRLHLGFSSRRLQTFVKDR